MSLALSWHAPGVGIANSGISSPYQQQTREAAGGAEQQAWGLGGGYPNHAVSIMPAHG
jgi:hypothetical protein